MGLGLEEDHEAVLGQIVETLVAERVDVLVIAGDVFDRASPPNSAVRQFNRFLKRVAEETEAAVVMISGNHDSGDRIETMSVFSSASRVLVRGIADAAEVPLVLCDSDGEVAFSALPFSYEYAAREVFGDETISTPADVIEAQLTAARAHVPKGARWVVVAHAFVAGGAVGETERSLTRVGGIETVAQTTGSGLRQHPLLWCAAGLWFRRGGRPKVHDDRRCEQGGSQNPHRAVSPAQTGAFAHRGIC
jgi:exonuclease SbcD